MPKVAINKKLRQIWYVIWITLNCFYQDNCPIMAAGMSFFGLLSLIPLTLLGVSLLGYILGSSADAQQFVSKLLSENFPGSVSEILGQINAIITSPGRALVNWLSVLGLVWSGMQFFSILQGVLNTVWVGATQRGIFWSRIFAFLIFVATGLFFWVSFMFTSLMMWISELNIIFMGIKLSDFRIFWFTVELVASLIAWIIMLFLVYWLVPHTRVSKRASLIGAIFAAVFLELSRSVFNLIMVKFDVYGRVYGPLASIIIFMSWLYLSMSILLLGAELGSQCQEIFFKKNSGNESEMEAK